MNKNDIINLLSFSSKERRGIIVLLLLIFVLLILNIFFDKFFSNKSNEIKIKREIEVFDNYLKDNEEEKKINFPKKKEYKNLEKLYEKNEITYFYFNPNNLPEEEWLKLGLTKRQVQVIKNYEAKGGRFYKKEDLKKLYCISENQYKLLEPWILIPEVKRDSLVYKQKSYYNNFDTSIIELNSADTIILRKTKWISDKLAKRIIAYREKLGGFVSKEQLLEVWGMDTTRYNKIKDRIIVNRNLIRKININQADLKTFLKHPYFDYEIALSIIKKREKVGKFKSIEEINGIDFIHKYIFQKIQAYITV